MARLTRTQKFAELRETLANDKEESIESKELSSYQNKLNNLTGEYPYQNQRGNQYPYQNQRPVETDPRYTWRDFDETPINDLVNQFKQEPNTIASSSVFNSIQEMPRSQSVTNDYDIARLEEEDYIDDLVDSIRIDTNPSYQAPRQQAQPAYQQPRYQQPQQPQYQQPQQPVYQQPQQPAYQQPIETPYQRPVEQPVYQQPVRQEPVYQQPVQQPVYQQPQQPVYEQPKVEPVVEEKPVEVKPVSKVEERLHDIEEFADFVNPTIEEPVKRETPIEQPQPVESVEIEQPVSKTVDIKADIPVDPESSRTTFNMFDRIQGMFDEAENEAANKPVDAEFVDRLEPDHSNETARSFVNETIKEVSDYNKQNGEQTIGQLTNNMVNEIRHHEEPKEVVEEPQEIRFEGNDEEFTNTVSMEISKIMDEIPADRKVEKPQPVIEEPEPVVEKHPVLTKKLEDTIEENVVEIKSLNELEAEQTLTRDTVSNTIPFVVTNDDDEDAEDDEEGSNMILNIILIVLIIILVVVLGLIVFYILKTKGII